MPGVWRSRHVVLSVDQLVPHPVILGEEQQVVVGELLARAGRIHAIAPGHRLIVASSEADGVPRVAFEKRDHCLRAHESERRKSRRTLFAVMAESADMRVGMF